MHSLAHSEYRRIRLRIGGLVQGVGFRPAVYRYATEAGLGGFVLNDGGGVIIEVEGSEERIDSFIGQLQTSPPPLARIDTIDRSELEPLGEREFRIEETDSLRERSAAVTPDIAVCDACIAEMYDPKNRRYRYPFINCTDCGPRYTIVETVPYDRPNTSMARFKMCEKCKKEYENPLQRRYHAQPISCPECGPRLGLWHGGRRLDLGGEEILERVARFLKEGMIVAVKGLGGFHLMCDATNGEAVRRLRERKRRPTKPFAIMVKDTEMAAKLAVMDENEEALLNSRERPIVLMKKGAECIRLQGVVSDKVAPGIDRIGLMLPYTPLHHLFFDYLDRPLVATSANLGDEPIIREMDELVQKLDHVVDAVLDHDRDIVNACDDSVVQVVSGKAQWLRVARGIAPMTIPLSFETEKEILAVGANQKSTIALAFGNKIVLSPHIGDLNTIESVEYFGRTVETFKRFYDFAPDIVVHDKHPAYETVKWAKSQKSENTALKSLSIQHHYAHALAVMAEHCVGEKALAFVWDGTGYGEDGTVWGGEVILADVHGFTRVASLRPFRLIGGEKAVKEPRRVALSLLFELFCLEDVLKLRSPTVDAFAPAEIKALHRAWQKGLNAPVTSSMGRLFDAVASLSGICQRVGYEGESGLLLEASTESAKDGNPEGFVMDVDEKGTIDWAPMVRKIVAGDHESASAAFIAALVEAVLKIAHRHPDIPLIFSGGVFQNRTLCEAVFKKLDNRKILLPERIPVNDGSICVGQIWYALHNVKKV